MQEERDLSDALDGLKALRDMLRCAGTDGGWRRRKTG